jgi:hypothetical protein
VRRPPGGRLDRLLRAAWFAPGADPSMGRLKLITAAGGASMASSGAQSKAMGWMPTSEKNETSDSWGTGGIT